MIQNVLEQLNTYKQNGQYEEIIELLESQTEQDYDTILFLAEAYNFRGEKGDYSKSIEILNMVRDLGSADTRWNFLLGCAYYHSGLYESAMPVFAHAADLDRDNKEKQDYFYKNLEKLQNRYGTPGEQTAPETYNDEEWDMISDFIEENFGMFDQVFHEIASPDVQIDICIIPPNEDRDFYTLATIGMGAHEMKVPEELKEYHLEKAELMICLPKDWKIHSEEDKWSWPIRLLKDLAHLSAEEDTWIGWGHTIDNGEAFDESTEQSASMLIYPASFGTCDTSCILSDGSEINFYQIIPLYREEMEFKVENSVEELLKHLDDKVLIVDPKRRKFCIEAMLS